MVNPRVANALVRLGYDVESCQRAGRANQGISDADQLAYATEQGRAILTFNVADFDRLDRQWKARGRVHAGIIVSVQIIHVPELARRIQLHLDTVPQVAQDNAVLELVG